MKWSPSSIRHLRCQMGWSQSELAMKLAINMELIRTWEEGLAGPQSEIEQQLDLFAKQAELSMRELARAPEIENQLAESDRDSVLF